VQRWQGLAEVPRPWPGSAVCIGVFDGVHRGHQAVLTRTIERAEQLGVASVVVTFDPHPSEVVRPGTTPPQLSTLEHRVALLAQAGVAAVCVLPFTAELAALSPEDFVRSVLVDRLHAKAVVVGENFRFGHRAAGDTATLERLGAEHGFVVDALGLRSGAGANWSSTHARSLVAAGDVEGAAQVLGRPHRVEGTVVHGDHRGRDLGYPTANLATTAHAAIPADGVYAAWLVPLPDGSSPVAGLQRLPAAVSVGTNPTFDGTQRRVEAYVLDRDDLDLYERHVALDLVARVRGMNRFDRVEDLLAAMARDVEQTRTLLG
jgi:riboflavin kinase/FMN adenylyltransferase